MNDHKHCISCFMPLKCKQLQNCEIIKCVNNQCELKFHKCKLEEHLNETCKYTLISCINSHYGCKTKLLRINLLKHLDNCPANIVECKAFRLRTVINKEKKYSNLKWPDPIRLEKISIGCESSAIAPKSTSPNKPLSKILLDIDYASLKKYANKNRLKFNCFYKYLLLNLNNDSDFENDKTQVFLKSYLQNNKIPSKIFHDIKIDNCIIFKDDTGCHSCQLRLSNLEQERYNKLTANLEFSELLKSVYSYEQFLAQKVYNDKAFLYLYNYLYDNQQQNNSFSSDLISNESSLNSELIKSNNDILRVMELNSTFSLVKVPSMIDDLKDSNERYKHLDKYSSFRHRQTIYSNTCNSLLKRSQYSSHYNFYHNFLNSMSEEIDKACPFSLYGCKVFTNKYKFYLNKKYKGSAGTVVNLKDSDCLAIKYYDEKYCKNSCNDDCFEKIPLEVIHYIIDKLDSLSLFNLSLTSKVRLSFLLKVLY